MIWSIWYDNKLKTIPEVRFGVFLSVSFLAGLEGLDFFDFGSSFFGVSGFFCWVTDLLGRLDGGGVSNSWDSSLFSTIFTILRNNQCLKMQKYFRNGETICGDKNLKIFSLDTHANRRIGENNQRSVKMTNPFLSSYFRLSSQLSVCLLNLFKEKLGYIHKGRPKKVVSVAVSGQCICLKLHKHTY